MVQLRQAKLWEKLIATAGRFAGPLLRAADYPDAQASIARPIKRDGLFNTVARMLDSARE